MRKRILLIILFTFIFSGCQTLRSPRESLRIATTTSLENSGLLSYLIPIFEDEYNIEIDLIAVGTGQALALGERGDVDLVLVHAPALEINFVESGYGVERHTIMYNDFVILGSSNDPAKISELTLSADAFISISENNSTFISRGDKSGTHYKENQIWNQANLNPENHDDWYLSVGQGMGASLQIANEKEAYILTDRGTYLSQKDNLPNLVLLFGGSSSDKNPDKLMRNVYSVIPISPKKHEDINLIDSNLFINWISSVEIQSLIGNFGIEKFEIPLFYPNSEEWNSLNSFDNSQSESQEEKFNPG